jgi:hypothetical protein
MMVAKLNQTPLLVNEQGHCLIAEPEGPWGSTTLGQAQRPQAGIQLLVGDATPGRRGFTSTFDTSLRLDGGFSGSTTALTTLPSVTLNLNFDSLLDVSPQMGAVGPLQHAKATFIGARNVIAEQIEALEMPDGLAFYDACEPTQQLVLTLRGAGLALLEHAVAPSQLAEIGCGPSVPFPSLCPVPEYSTYFESVLDELQVFACAVRTVVRDFLRAWDLKFALAIRFIQSRLSARFRCLSRLVTFFCSVSWPKRRWFLCHGARPPKKQATLDPFLEACSGSAFAS